MDRSSVGRTYVTETSIESYDGFKIRVACYFWIFPYTTKVIRVRLNMTTIFVFSVKLICNAIDFMSILSCCSSPVKVDMPPTCRISGTATLVSAESHGESRQGTTYTWQRVPVFCVFVSFCLVCLFVCLFVFSVMNSHFRDPMAVDPVRTRSKSPWHSSSANTTFSLGG